MHNGTPLYLCSKDELLARISAAPEDERVTVLDLWFANLDLSVVDFSRVSFENCVFNSCHLDFSRFNGAGLKHCELNNCWLTGAYMSRATLHGSKFVDCKLDFVLLDGAEVKQCTFHQSNAENINLNESTVIESTFRNSFFTKPAFQDADVSRVEFVNTTFENADIRDAKFDQCVFDNAKIRRSFFVGAEVTRCRFKMGSRIEKCSISTSRFTHSHFTGSSSVDKCIIRQTSFASVTSDNFRLDGNSIEDCDFTDATIKDELKDNIFVDGKFARAQLIAVNGYHHGDPPRGFKFAPGNGPGDKRWFLFGPGVRLDGVNFGSIDKTDSTLLAGVRTGSSFDSCNFEHVRLGPGKWRDANFRASTFSFACVRDVDFSGADFTDVQFMRSEPSRRDYDDPLERYGLLGLRGTNTFAPIMYNDGTTWPTGFSVPEIACHEKDLDAAMRLNANICGVDVPLFTGLVFMPSPDVHNTMTYLFAVLPELFEICGPVAVPTRAARVAEQALTSFAASVRKDDAGNKIESFREKLEFAAMAVAAAGWSAAQVSATQDTQAKPTEYLAKTLAEVVASRRRANRYAAKKGTSQ